MTFFLRHCFYYSKNTRSIFIPSARRPWASFQILNLESWIMNHEQIPVSKIQNTKQF